MIIATIARASAFRTTEAPRGAVWAAEAVDALRSAWSHLAGRVDHALAADVPSPAASRELLALADEYEATQPSYAADLRAAAQFAQRTL